MQARTAWLARTFVGMVIFFSLASAICAWGASAKIIHAFGNVGDGYDPTGVVIDAQGNLYGTTAFGPGTCFYGQDGYGCGVVFELTSDQNGNWNESILHMFNPFVDGGNPNTPLLDPHGNLIGSTACALTDCEYGGYIYELVAGASWNEILLYHFQGGSDGDGRTAWLSLDPAGRLFGTSQHGGTFPNDGGIVFTLSTGNIPHELILHQFPDDGSQGREQNGPLAFDGTGSLYGATILGGPNNAGVVYKLTPNTGRAGWTYKLLYAFTGGNDGGNPYGGVVIDSAGNLYGTTENGGAAGLGTVFRLSPNSDGTWTETVLHSFTGGNDGQYPTTNLTFDASGNLYGTTGSGGPANYGTVYEMVSDGHGDWTESIVYAFTGNGDGGDPSSGVVLNAEGNIFGVGLGEGQAMCDENLPCGFVYEITR